ncbi:sporulation histidine kinase inhibitor Sda [Shouchella xiaoxiensis]|uniref:sporulation histidine kinase inhibitor Sda n=1 Tax=Shouchella xiaoxiensis TaxID=766895 RepID=UPI003F5A361E
MSPVTTNGASLHHKIGGCQLPLKQVSVDILYEAYQYAVHNNLPEDLLKLLRDELLSRGFQL